MLLSDPNTCPSPPVILCVPDRGPCTACVQILNILIFRLYFSPLVLWKQNYNAGASRICIKIQDVLRWFWFASKFGDHWTTSCYRPVGEDTFKDKKMKDEHLAIQRLWYLGHSLWPTQWSQLSPLPVQQESCMNSAGPNWFTSYLHHALIPHSVGDGSSK